MKTNRTKVGDAGEFLAQEEWYFGKVPDREVETCFYYEYARSRDDIRQLVKLWRERFADPNELEKWWYQNFRNDTYFSKDERAKLEHWRDLAELTDWTSAQMLLNVPDFPECSWQKLNHSFRDKFGTFLSYYSHLEGIIGGVVPWPLERAISAHRGFESLPKKTEIACFRIDWRGGVEKVIRDFEVLARASYAKLSKRKKPRDSSRDYLKQLGVMRLKNAYTSWDAVIEHTKHVLGHSLYGGDHAVWSRAATAARKRVAEMFPIKRAHV
jgi:hypothetical protein